MSLVTTARFLAGQRRLLRQSTRAVLPLPTGPAMPTRYARMLLDGIITANEADCALYESSRRLCCLHRGTARREHAGSHYRRGSRKSARSGRVGIGGKPRDGGTVDGGRDRGHSRSLRTSHRVKRADLLRHLKKHGCEFLREGNNHTVYVN